MLPFCKVGHFRVVVVAVVVVVVVVIFCVFLFTYVASCHEIGVDGPVIGGLLGASVIEPER